jgi:hypothetical protein
VRFAPVVGCGRRGRLAAGVPARLAGHGGWLETCVVSLTRGNR